MTYFVVKQGFITKELRHRKEFSFSRGNSEIYFGTVRGNGISALEAQTNNSVFVVFMFMLMSSALLV